MLRLDADLRRKCRAHVVRSSQHPLEVRLPDAAALQICLPLLPHRVDRRPGERPERARVEIRDVLEDREERARLGEASSDRDLDRRVVGEQTPF